MCLSTLAKPRKDWKREGVGYKVLLFHPASGRLAGTNYGLDADGYKLNQWYKADKILLRGYGTNKLSYMSGFHIFTKLKDAEIYLKGEREDPGYSLPAIYKVEYRGLTSRGTQDGLFLNGGVTIVADEMKVLEKVV